MIAHNGSGKGKTTARSEFVEQVAGRIIEQLEKGVAPWQKPWKPGEYSRPYNALTKEPYRGINSVWLSAQGYDDPRWLTFKQAQSIGAHVRKGEHGLRLIRYKTFDVVTLKNEQGEVVLDEQGNPVKKSVPLEHPIVSWFVVFNARQIEGLPELERRTVEIDESRRNWMVEQVMERSGADIRHIAGDRAFYRPSDDFIVLPYPHQFEDLSAYYATALHELGHWTGHPERLDRPLTGDKGSIEYAREELVAEIASLIMSERFHVGYDPSQHMSYVASWIKLLKNDPEEIFRAASKAEGIDRFLARFAPRHEEDVSDDLDFGEHEPRQETGLAAGF